MDLTDILFVVMAGSLHLERLYAVRETWGSLVPHLLAIGDINHTATGMLTLEGLAGKHNYYDAQHRSLFGLRYGVQSGLWAKQKWIMMVDDDTYVNTHELPGFLIGWDHRLPLIFGHVWYGPEMRNRDEGSWPSGGAGIILSKRAAELLAENLYSETCPFMVLNDVTLGHCAWALGIPMIHSPLFDPEGNVFVPGTRTIKRKKRKDGSLVRPPSCFTEAWQPVGEVRHWSEDVDRKGPDGKELTKEQLEEKYGKPESWETVEEAVIVRPPLVEVYKSRTAIEATLVIHRATPAIMRDIHANFTAAVREWAELDTALGRQGVDTYEEALLAQGLRGPYSAEDLAVMESTTTKYTPPKS